MGSIEITGRFQCILAKHGVCICRCMVALGFSIPFGMFYLRDDIFVTILMATYGTNKKIGKSVVNDEEHIPESRICKIPLQFLDFTLQDNGRLTQCFHIMQRVIGTKQ
jgi:hypothetical protein